jgi:uncharacterized NTF2-like protein DUF6841
LLDATHTRLNANDYSYTEVLDRAVHTYHRNGAAIEVIWSRRRGNGTEIASGSAFRGNTHSERLADRWHPTTTRKGRPAHRQMDGNRPNVIRTLKGEENEGYSL